MNVLGGFGIVQRPPGVVHVYIVVRDAYFGLLVNPVKVLQYDSDVHVDQGDVGDDDKGDEVKLG